MNEQENSSGTYSPVLAAKIAMEESIKLFEPPDNLTEEERAVWDGFIEVLKNGTRYKKTPADIELVQQYVQHKVMRDRAWLEWNKKPERYIRFVTGLCSDGTTPKIVVKENEHYRILNECNKYLERLLTDLKLTPNARIR